MINILEEIIAEEECFTIKDLEVNGYDLMELGVFDKRIKEIQLVLLDLVVEEKIENKKEILIDYIKNNLLQKAIRKLLFIIYDGSFLIYIYIQKYYKLQLDIITKFIK